MNADVDGRITYVMNLAGENYKEMWEILSHLTVTPKVAIEAVFSSSKSFSHCFYFSVLFLMLDGFS